MLELDPLSSGGFASFEIIANQLRLSLASPARPVDAADTQQLDALLLETGTADNTSHIAMARHLAAAKRNDSALSILEAVIRLDPTCEAAWAELLPIAEQAGKEELAEHARLSMESLRTERRPSFAMPERASA